MVNDDLDLDTLLVSPELAAWANREDGDEENLVPASIRAEVAALLKQVAEATALLKSTAGPDPDSLMNSHEVAALLKVCDRTVERQRTAGTGPAFVVMGGVIRYARRDVLAFIQRNRRFSTSDVNSASQATNSAPRQRLTPRIRRRPQTRQLQTHAEHPRSMHEEGLNAAPSRGASPRKAHRDVKSREQSRTHNQTDGVTTRRAPNGTTL
jgi:hypothetical protein